jgi:hypothetical protein
MIANEWQTENKKFYILAFIGILAIAFFQCYRVSHDLIWPSDVDHYRDMAYVQGNLYGDFGKDPNFVGRYMWYNPLLALIETAIVKISGLPINVVFARVGVYLNLFGPVAFMFMMLLIGGARVTLASLLSFLFLASGQLPFYYAPTYSPWVLPVSFSQFFFYLNIILCYKAFTSQKNIWFFILGTMIGISFLAHTAPAIMIILVMFFIQYPKIFSSLRSKDYFSLRKYLVQSIITLVPFLIASLPLTYYIVGKYHMHYLNRQPSEYVDTIFLMRNFLGMIKSNLSISFIIAAIGFVWFYRNFRQPLLRKIIFAWLFASVFMYLYSTAVATLDNRFDIHLPGAVPSFHFFYYLKALQSVFFGFGFVAISAPIIKWLGKLLPQRSESQTKSAADILFVASVFLCAIVYFPFYENRFDFVHNREESIIKANEKDKIEVYNYIMKNIPRDKVILAGDDTTSVFPVMSTARKMVCMYGTFSNPYFEWNDRQNDWITMVNFLKKNEPPTTERLGLFNKYQVNFVLLKKDSFAGNGQNDSTSLLKKVVFENASYFMYKLDR